MSERAQLNEENMENRKFIHHAIWKEHIKTSGCIETLNSLSRFPFSPEPISKKFDCLPNKMNLSLLRAPHSIGKTIFPIHRNSFSKNEIFYNLPSCSSYLFWSSPCVAEEANQMEFMGSVRCGHASGEWYPLWRNQHNFWNVINIFISGCLRLYFYLLLLLFILHNHK